MNKKVLKENMRLYALRKKLMSALVLLIVASLMMVGSTYAWFVMSTAPEVTGITTQVGANGSLEIALLNTASYNNLSLLDMADFDESAAIGATNANLTWGNLVNLNDPSYGLSQVVLMPARLNISQYGTDDDGALLHKVGTMLLKTPKYGEDGRVQSLETAAISSVYADGVFSAANTQSYGVRAIGTSSNQSVYQMAINSARNAIATATSAARTAASNTLNVTGGALGQIVVKYALENKTTGYGAADIQALKDLAEGLDGALLQIDKALRSVYAAYIASTLYTQPTGWDYEAALAEIQTAPLTSLNTKYPTVDGLDMETYISTLNTDIGKIEGAISDCDTLLARNPQSYTWDEITTTMMPLVNYQQMTMAGKTLTELKDMDVSDLALVIMNGGVTITVPSGSGVLSDIADFAGNYTAKVEVEHITYAGFFNDDSIPATMTTATNKNPVYLVACSRSVGAFTAAEAVASSGITDFFGYAIDLAFRTNAGTSSTGGVPHLCLQTEPENRVYTGSNENAGLQGGGSYMEYTTGSGISTTKMIKLMSAIRVVFMDSENGVLAIAALDTALGQDAYRVLPEAERTSTKYAVIDSAVTGVPSQNSDYISQTAYAALPQKSMVVFNSEAKSIKAKLYIYNYHMTVSTVQKDNGTYGLTGGITLDGKADTSAITALVQDEAKIVTAMVYLDGSFVFNSMVAADSSYSMTGKLNLQFASDAELIPAEVSDLRNGKVTYTSFATEGQAYTMGALTGTVKEGYTIYKGSNDKYYFSTDGTNYTELTVANVETAITVTVPTP